jgi:hypothetical protein
VTFECKVPRILGTLHSKVVTKISPINTKAPKEQFNLDFTDLKTCELGKPLLFAIIDHFSKYALFFHLRW